MALHHFFNCQVTFLFHDDSQKISSCIMHPLLFKMCKKKLLIIELYFNYWFILQIFEIGEVPSNFVIYILIMFTNQLKIADAHPIWVNSSASRGHLTKWIQNLHEVAFQSSNAYDFKRHFSVFRKTKSFFKNLVKS